MRKCKLTLKNIKGEVYTVVKEASQTGLRYTMEFGEDKVIGYTWL